MVHSTFDRLCERRNYILKKMGSKYSSKWYMSLVTEITEHHVFNASVGYCGAGDDSCKKESVSSKLVPDPKCINFSCWFHDRLYELVDKNFIEYEMADLIMRYSGYYDANKQKGITKIKSILVTRLYYRGVQARTFFSKLFN